MILVIGDSCTDKFIYGECARLCPEAPVPVFSPIKTLSNLGMAGNVRANLISLGEKTQIQTNNNTIEKTRIVDIKTNQMLVRIDTNDACDRISASTINLYNTSPYSEFKGKLKAVVISDYNKGFLTSEDIKQISTQYSCPIFLDTKKKLGEWCQNIDFIKINEIEYLNTVNTLKGLDLNKKLIVTKGEKGAHYMDKNYPTRKCNIKDLSGAGDTFLAGLVHKYIKTNNIEQSIKFANNVASQAVQKRGVVTISLR